MAGLKFNTFQHVKKVFKKSANAVCSSWVSHLPESPSEFKERFGDVFAAAFPNSLPITLQWDSVQFEALCSSIPMRSSNKLIMAAPMAQTAEASMMPAFMQQMMQFMMQTQQPGMASSRAPELDIQFVEPRAKSLAAASGSGVQALADGEVLGPKPAMAADRVEEFAADEVPETKPAVANAKKKAKRMSIKDSTDFILNQIEKRDEAAKAKSKAKGKAKSKAKATVAAKGVGKAKAKAKEKASSKSLPSIGMKWSRNQVMCRAVDGSCKGIKFAAAGGKNKAIKEAEAWLAKERKKAMKS